MVMEETPSPHVVGREFVRQYYTLLNQAPMHLHRFYNEHSSFVHGGLDNGTHETKPVIGQRQIHQCITQLDFNDCHAKIQQVDSQATLGNGVVVQVTGELSNNGGPMRRFTQTFVLAQQSPKKYYVHNDIFRYQDEMVNDEEPDYNRAEPEGEEPTKEIINRGPANIMNYYNETQPANPPMQQPPMGYPPQGMVEAVPQPTMQVNPMMMQQNNGPVNNYMPETRDVPVQQQQQQNAVISDTEPEEAIQEPEIIEVKPEEVAPPAQLQPAEEVVVEENRGPKTFASMFKPKGQSAAPPQMRTKSPIVQPEAPQPVTKATSPQSGGQGGGQQQQQGSLPPRQGMQKQGGPVNNNKPRGDHRDNRNENRGPPRSNGEDKRESMGRERDRDVQGVDDRRRSLGGPGGGGPARYPDNHQVFVGNIPLDAPENDVRNVFSKYGNVVDIRIINSKNMSGKVFPKYGFVIFSDTTAVHNCLSSKPVMMPGETPHNLNVEEKRPRNQTPLGERGGGMGGGNRGGRGGYRPNYERADR